MLCSCYMHWPYLVTLQHSDYSGKCSIDRGVLPVYDAASFCVPRNWYDYHDSFDRMESEGWGMGWSTDYNILELPPHSILVHRIDTETNHFSSYSIPVSMNFFLWVSPKKKSTSSNENRFSPPPLFAYTRHFLQHQFNIFLLSIIRVWITICSGLLNKDVHSCFSLIKKLWMWTTTAGGKSMNCVLPDVTFF